MAPRKRKYGQHGARATSGGRKVKPYVGHSLQLRMNSEIMVGGREVWRRRVDGPHVPLGTWDSIVHRYGREVGFTPADSQNIDDSGDVRMQEVGACVSTLTNKSPKI